MKIAYNAPSKGSLIVKVNWIEVENIKSFKDTTRITINPDSNFIVGTNGSGKTTLFQILSTCLLEVVPQYKADMMSRGEDKRVRFQTPTFNINLPKNFNKLDDKQSVTIEVSFEESVEGLIKEIELYIGVFKENEEYITANYWDFENLVERIQKNLSALKETSSYIFEIEFSIAQQSVSISPESREKNGVILNVLGEIEQLRLLHSQLFRLGKTSTIIEKGFRLIYPGSERTIGFPREVSLNRGNVEEYLNNASYNRISDIKSHIFSSNSFDYIGQSLSSISEKIVHERWNKGNLSPLEDIKEYVTLRTKIKEILGFDFLIEVSGTPFEPIRPYFMNDGSELIFENFSSGEKSLLNFIFILANLEISNSFLIIDEAEIHLHSNMQDELISLILDKRELNNQVFVSTHSPKLVNTLTVSSVLRFYKQKNVSQYINFRSDARLGGKYDLIRLINSQNNEKVFFADKVVLVEGIIDRVLFESLIKPINDTGQIIEVIDVVGKHNLKFYKDYLDEIKVPNLIVADFDYLPDISGSEVGELFEPNTKKIDEIIKRKKSGDRLSLIESIEKYIQDKDAGQLSKTVEYLKGRGKNLKAELTDSEKEKLKNTLRGHKQKGVLIINAGLLAKNRDCTGEVEDYLVHTGVGRNNVESANRLVEYISNSLFIEDMVLQLGAESRHELFGFVTLIIYESEDMSKLVIEEYTSRSKARLLEILNSLGKS